MSQEQDISQAAIAAFNNALQSPIKDGELISLKKAGWREEFPQPEYWHFTHPDFPNGEVRWSPGSGLKPGWVPFPPA